MLGCIYDNFNKDTNIINGTFQQLSIEAPVQSIVIINNQEFYIGGTGILEFDEEVNIEELHFPKNTRALITYEQ